MTDIEERVLRLEQELLRLRRSHAGLEIGAGLNRLGQDTEIDGDLTLTGEIEAAGVGTALLAAVEAAISVPWAQVTDKPEIDAANINWASDATIVGWSSRTSTFIRYASVGPLVFVSFYITGTSNSVNTTFTLPFSVTGMTIRPVCRIRNNGTYGVGSIYLFGDTATFYIDAAGSSWTASGTKEIAGEFFYWKA